MKKVIFKLENNEIFNTYTKEEYDRFQIDSVLYRRNYQRVPDQEWNNIYVVLDLYKLYDMPVHQESVQNNLYHLKKITF